MGIWKSLLSLLKKTFDGNKLSMAENQSRIELQFSADAISDIGPAREVNEDAVLTVDLPRSNGSSVSGLLAVVADGMGGHAHGEIASRLACDVLAEMMREGGTRKPITFLTQGVERANRSIFAEAGADPAKQGMGTTMVALLAFGGEAMIAHVGDSRAYLLRAGTIRQLTEDHTLVGQMEREGLITGDEARIHPDRNIITRALGLSDRIDADLIEIPGGVLDGDRLCLCSDGLHGVIEDSEILSILDKLAPREACRRLVDRAIEQGTTDNVSVIVIHALEARLNPVSETSLRPTVDEGVEA